MSSIMGAKAISMLNNGKVRKLEGRGEFEVEGRTDTYRVHLAQKLEDDDVCDCAAGGFGNRCSHVLACKLFLSRERAS